MAMKIKYFANALPLVALTWITLSILCEESLAHETGVLYSQVSLSSWQDPVNLNIPGAPTTQLYADPIGLCPGVGYRKAFAPQWEWDVNACAFFGRADVAVSSGSASSSSYSAKNVFVFGMQSQAGVLWKPAGQPFQLGLGLPLLLRHADWPTDTGDGAGTNISSNTKLQTGVLIESRFYAKNGLCFDPKLEWLQTARNLLWSINLSFGI